MAVSETFYFGGPKMKGVTRHKKCLCAFFCILVSAGFFLGFNNTNVQLQDCVLSSSRAATDRISTDIVRRAVSPR